MNENKGVLMQGNKALSQYLKYTLFDYIIYVIII